MNRIFKIALSMAVVAGAFAATTPAEANDCCNTNVNRRQVRQQNRIQHGVRTDSLTRKEAGRLRVAQANMAAREARMRASGGGLTCKERARIDNQQDHLSKQIYNQKHDNQSR